MTDYQHQRTILQWAIYCSNRIKYPGLELLYHIPNEVKCTAAQGKSRKDIGVKSGVPDLCLPVARGGYHGLYIELKAEKGKATENQKTWIQQLTEQGYLAKVCYGFDEAIRCIISYYQEGV